MRVIFVIAIVVIGGAAVAGWLVLRVAGGVTAYHDTARAFLDSAIEGDGTAAVSLLHPQMRTDWPADRIADSFDGAVPFVSVRFPSISYSTENGLSRATITGAGETLGGCISQLQFDFLNDTITRFTVEPICGGDGIEI